MIELKKLDALPPYLSLHRHTHCIHTYILSWLINELKTHIFYSK